MSQNIQKFFFAKSLIFFDLRTKSSPFETAFEIVSAHRENAT